MIDPNWMIKTSKIFQGENFLDMKSILIIPKLIDNTIIFEHLCAGKKLRGLQVHADNSVFLYTRLFAVAGRDTLLKWVT